MAKAPRETFDLEDYYSVLTSLVNQSDIKKAINTNDFDLAMKNFKKIEPFLLRISSTDSCPITSGVIDTFYAFVAEVKANGFVKFFGDNPITEWSKTEGMHERGFNVFLHNVKIPKVEVK